MAREFSEVVFSLVDLKVATYNILTDVVGTAVDLPEAQELEFSAEGDTDEIKAEGYLQHLLTVVTHATVSLSSAGVPFTALAIMTGMANDSSDTTPNQQRTSQLTPGGAGLPYFAVGGKLVGEQGDDLHVGLVCVKLDSIPSWKAEQNKFVMSPASGKAIAPNSRKLIYLRGHETAADIDFTTLFSGL